MQAKLATGMLDLGRLVQRAGPYFVLELLLPGGTLIALLLYLYRSGQLRSLSDVVKAVRAVAQAGSRAFDQLAFALQPVGLGATSSARDGLEPLDLFTGGR